MNVKSRIISIRLMEKAENYPKYAKEIGMSIHMGRLDNKNNKNTTEQGEKHYGLEEK